jgi:putative ABC transport system substrate-binding protein
VEANVRRRELIILIGGAAAWPVIGAAEQADRILRIGVMMATSESDPVTQARVSALRQGLQALGWIEGRNIRIDYRWDVGGPDRARGAAKELAALRPNVILPSTTPTLAAIRQETQSLPIVFVNVSDPIGTGLV